MLTIEVPGPMTGKGQRDGGWQSTARFLTCGWGHRTLTDKVRRLA